jgi:hypothetical protein
MHLNTLHKNEKKHINQLTNFLFGTKTKQAIYVLILILVHCVQEHLTTICL